MTFLNAAYAPWLLAVAIPIAVHLLTRQAVQVYSLPTFRFLQQSVARQSKIFKIRHLLLLILRALLVAMLVVVFLKPVRVAPLNSLSAGNRAALIVLDNSLSMSYSRSGVTSLQKAQAQATKILSGLGPGDKANLIVAQATANAELPSPSTDISTLKQTITRLSPSFERCDAAAAIAAALEQLAKSGARGKELYIVSDFQRSNWAYVKTDTIPADVQVVFVGTEEAERDNSGITAMRLRPSTPRAGDDIAVVVEAWNGTASPRSIPLTLRAGNAQPQTHAVATAPYSTVTATFPVYFPDPGRYVCVASTPADSLNADNTRWMVADLQHTLKVLLLTDENAAASPNGSYFVSRALNPTPDLPGGIRVIPKHASEMSPSDLRDADAVIISNVVTMPADRLPALLRYVKSGGALLVFLYGDRVQVQMEALNRLAGNGEGLPFVPTRLTDVHAQGKGYVSLAEARYESRLLRVFKDPSAADLGKIRFSQFFLTTEVDGRAETLLKFEDGTPAAARRSLGSGNVVLLNFSPSPRGGDLVKQEVFPPLMHELLKGIARGESERREFTCGGPASAVIPPPKGAVTTLAPDGSAAPTTVDKVGGGVVVERAPLPGIYTISESGKEAAQIAVNIHADESDLRSLDPRELQSRQNKRASYLVGGPGSGMQLEELSKNRPIWPYALVAVLCLLKMEQALSSLKGRSVSKS